jgi:hypothetical protein
MGMKIHSSAFFLIAFLNVLCSSMSFAQNERVGSKPIPQSSMFIEEDSSRDVAVDTTSPLPLIRLPEYYIVGSAPIEIALSDKPIILFPETFSLYHLAKRTDEKSVANSSDTLLNPLYEKNKMYTGYVQASGGTFSTYGIEVRQGYNSPTLQVVGKGKYNISHGFASYTNRSSGGVDLGASSMVSIPNLLTDGILKGQAIYNSETYRFYGSANPNQDRNKSFFLATASLSDPIEFPASQLVLGFRSFTAKDTGTSRTENLFTMNGGSIFHFLPIDLKADLDLKVASKGLASMQVKAQVERYEWHNIFFDGALLISWLKGMDGQNFVRPYPWLGISSYLLPRHRFYLRYQPMPHFQSLWDLMDACPYLSAQSIIRHQNITNAGIFGIESHWTSDIQSNAQVSVQTIKDYALLKELRQGWWETMYKERVTVVSFLGELVAKLAVNDYFSTQMKVQSGTVKHGLKAPYLPVIEVREMWEHSFSDVARSNVLVRYIGRRYSIDSIENTSKLSPIFLMDVNGEYDIRSNIKLTLEVQNLTNSKFSWWDNYRAEPFIIRLGARFQW